MRITRNLVLTIIAYIVVGLIFVSLATYAVLFASGYRVDFASREVARTGIISVDSNPHGAQLSINGKELRRSTPTSIKYLLPGEYRVEVTQEGTQGYKHDKVIVHPGFITDLSHLFLFYTQPQPIPGSEAIKAEQILWKGGDAFIYQSGEQFYFLPFDNPKPIQIFDKTKATIDSRNLNFTGWTLADIKVSPNNQQVILAFQRRSQKTTLLISDFSKPVVRELSDIASAKKLFWQDNRRLFVWQSGVNAETINTDNLERTKVTLTLEPKTVVQSGNRILMVMTSTQKVPALYDLEGRLVQDDLPLGDDYIIHSMEPLTLEVLTPHAKTLWLWHSDRKSWERVTGGLKNLWMLERKLLYANDETLSVFHFNPQFPEEELPMILASNLNKDPQLIVRGNYAFYLNTAGQLVAVNLAGGSTSQLAANAKTFWIDAKGLVAYVLQGDQLVALELRDSRSTLNAFREILLRHNTEIYNQAD